MGVVAESPAIAIIEAIGQPLSSAMAGARTGRA